MRIRRTSSSRTSKDSAHAAVPSAAQLSTTRWPVGQKFDRARRPPSHSFARGFSTDTSVSSVRMREASSRHTLRAGLRELRRRFLRAPLALT